MLLPFIIAGCARQPLILTNAVEDAHREGVDAYVVAPFEDGMRTHGGKGTVEWWYFDGHLDDGSTLVANFLTKPIMKRSSALAPKLEITLTEPDGQVYQSFTFHDPTAFSASAEGCDVRIDTSTIVGDLETYRLHLESPDVTADLVLSRVVDSWRPGAGKVYFDEDRERYLGWVVPVPYGTVTGTLTVRGVTRDVTGSGYHDHNWTNYDISKPLDQWYWGRGHLGDLTTLYIVAEGSRRWGHAQLQLFMVAKGSEVVMGDSEGLSLATRAFTTTDPPYPRELRLQVSQGGHEVTMAMLNPEVLEQEDLLASLPVVTQWVARRFMDPWYLRFEADTTLVLDAQEETGETLYELMLFR